MAARDAAIIRFRIEPNGRSAMHAYRPPR